MKKLIALLLALVMVFALAACAAKSETPASSISSGRQSPPAPQQLLLI